MIHHNIHPSKEKDTLPLGHLFFLHAHLDIDFHLEQT